MILVTGATGNVGRHVVAQLRAAGTPVRAFVRRPVGLPAGVEAVAGDLGDPDTLPAGLAGVRVAFLFPVPGCGPAFAAAARAAGVGRIVALSSAEIVDTAAVQPDGVTGFHAAIEQAVQASGVPWTFVRSAAFAANTLQWAGQIRSGDTVSAPYPQASFAPIHEADVAAVIARALVDDGHAGARYRVTGPAALTQAEQLAVIGAALGRELRFAEVPPEVARERMLHRLPAPIVDGLLRIFAAATQRPAEVLPTVAEVTGRQPRTFAEWAADHRADFQ
jgi:uncharacterized protein YbjT (DUF2867 family)